MAMNKVKNIWGYIMLLFLVSGCLYAQELPGDALIESALSDAKTHGVGVQYLVKGDLVTKDKYTLADGSIIPAMTGEELFIQNYSPALKVVSISGKHVVFSFLSNKNSLPEPINRTVSVAEGVISYEIH